MQTLNRSSALRRAAALAGAGALIVPLAGCGSSSSSSSTKSQSGAATSSSTSTTPATPQSPKQQYVTKAGVVCQQLSEEIRTVGTNSKPLKQKSEELVVQRERANERLKALPVPSGDKLAVEWIRARQHAFRQPQHQPVTLQPRAAQRRQHRRGQRRVAFQPRRRRNT